MNFTDDDNVLFVGEKRVGKTTMMRAALADCMARGRPVVVLDCCDEYRLPGEQLISEDRAAERLARLLLSDVRPLRARVLIRHAGPEIADDLAMVFHHLRNATVVIDEVYQYCRTSVSAPKELEIFLRAETGSNHHGCNVLVASQLADIPISIRCAITKVCLMRMADEHLSRLYSRSVIRSVPEFLPERAPYPLGYLGQCFWY
jgi:hypothetical protein